RCQGAQAPTLVHRSPGSFSRAVPPPSIGPVERSNCQFDRVGFVLPRRSCSSGQYVRHRAAHAGSSAHSVSMSGSLPLGSSARLLARLVLPTGLVVLLPSDLSRLPAPYDGC